MSKFSIIFDPSTDNKETVVAQVTQMFAIFGALTGNAPAAVEQEEAATPSTATHDGTGLPWDARIHSDPASLTAKNVWRAKRGVDKALVAQVEAELRGQQPQIATPAPVAAPAAPAPLAMPTLAAPAPLAAPAAPFVPTTYDHLVKLVGDNMNTPQNPAGRIDDAWLTAALNTYGVAGGQLPNVRSMPEQQQLDIYNAIKQALGL